MSGNKIMTALKDYAERAASTFVQVFVVVLFAAGTPILGDPAWGLAALAGIVAAGVSILTSLASAPLPAATPFVDLVLRSVKTGLQAFVGALVVSNYIEVNWSGALAVAIPAALLALAKGFVALSVPGTEPGPSLAPDESGMRDSWMKDALARAEANRDTSGARDSWMKDALERGKHAAD